MHACTNVYTLRQNLKASVAVTAEHVGAFSVCAAETAQAAVREQAQVCADVCVDMCADACVDAAAGRAPTRPAWQKALGAEAVVTGNRHCLRPRARNAVGGADIEPSAVPI